jgi:Holliday junction resolvasome RuvABC endonuclease subunit
MNERFGKKSIRVLAVDPGTRGFGYAVFESPKRLVDWGTKDIRKDKEQVTLVKVEELLRRFEPDVLVVEDCAHVSSRRNRKFTLLIGRMLATARALGIEGHVLPLALVYQHFAKRGARNKQEIASALAQRFAALALRLPPKRKPWQSEDPRMSIFDAVALGYAYLAKRHREK